MYSSFNIPEEFEGSCARHACDEEFGGDVFNSFYQWVSLCLVSQAVIFYLPRALWVSLEGGLMKHLAKDAGGKVVEDAEKKMTGVSFQLARALRMGAGHGQEEKIRQNLKSESVEIPKMTAKIKDHKEVIDGEPVKVRPVCGAVEAPCGQLSNT